MLDIYSAPRLPTLANASATSAQRRAAMVVCAGFIVVTLCFLPMVGQPLAPMPGFIPAYQAALITVYAVTTYLLFAQYRRTRSVPLLVLAAGGLFTTLIVLIQLLSFPNIFGPQRILGVGPDTTTWLWTLWHIGPPLFAIPYAILESRKPEGQIDPARVVPAERYTVLATLAVVGLLTALVTRYVHLLPKTVQGDDYWLLTTSGVGPSVVVLNVLALVILCWTTRLRTVLQLWLAVSLFLLVLDNAVTLPGAARGTLGWLAGRMGALIAGVILLAVYLREVDFLYGQAEHTAAERERQRADLQLARDNLAIALEAADMGDWELDVATGQSRRTLRHDRIFGYESLKPDWDLTTLREHVVAEDQDLVEAAFARATLDGHLECECRIQRAGDGTTRWIALRGKGYFDGSGKLLTMAGVVMDTTERREAQERLNQTQKMEAIGQLTGGVAHDFNNLLTIIIGNLDMIGRRPGDIQRVERLAASAMTAARRGAEVTEKLLSFSRRQVLRPETVNPNRLLTDFRSVLQRAVGETIPITLDLDASLDPVRLDPGQFESAILNLTVNARDAMPRGGTVTIKTGNVVVGTAGIEDIRDLASGDYVAVSVSDTGTGMDPATKARAFEPFFTTKDVGKGTGLDLSQVYGFAKQAGGNVGLISAAGDGTTITIYLPRSAERASEVSSENTMPLRRASDGEVILVVEDEAAVLEMAVESLEELGYRTLTASQGAAAIDLLKGSDRIDILFSDVVMPGGMNGVQLAVEARRLRPNLRVLLTSGYTASALGEQGVPPDQPLLSKPYLRKDLAEKLRVVMGRR